MKTQLVSIIIVNWNGGEVLRKCLKSLEKINYPNWELIIVDNGSTDGSNRINLTKKYTLISNSSNLGFAEANNQGCKAAKGRYILLLNNDTEVTKEFLSQMVQRMEADQSIGAMQPKIRLISNRSILDNCGSQMTQTGLLKHLGFMQLDKGQYNKELEVFSAKGACLLTRREVIQKIGLFDNNFGSYFEESDFCYRIWLSGWRVIYYPRALIYHTLGYTSGRMSAIEINFNSTKNRIASYIKNMEYKSLATIFILHLILITGLGFYYALKFQLNKSVMIFRSIIWNMKNLSYLLNQRKKIQQARIVTDRDIFKTVLVRVSINELLSHFRKVEANFK